MRIPYGMSNFADIRRERYFYVDKTPYITRLESPESGYRHLIFLRPRRIGKSLFLSMLEYYYDLARADEFDELFRGLHVHAQPTPERSRYLVLSLDFSTVNTSEGIEVLQDTFFESVRARVEEFLLRYRLLIPELNRLLDRLSAHQKADTLLSALFALARGLGYKVYLLIDEYDSFTNDLIASGHQTLYETIVERTGFLRSFYKTLKSGTQTGALARLFMTGVSPITLDDLASGFNIVAHVSQHSQLNAMAGFTRADVLDAVTLFRADNPELAPLPALSDTESLMAVLEEYYNGYRFSPQARERVFNSDMVLYFFKELKTQEGFPRQMLDRNVRTDYGKLQLLAKMIGAGGGLHRELLETLLSEGGVFTELTEQFGVKSLSTRQEFLSLLYYLGLLTLSAQPEHSLMLRLEIPNRVIRELQWEHLASILTFEEGVKLDTTDLQQVVETMAVRGEIHPFLELFHARVVKALGLKDLRRFDEKHLKLMLLTFLSLSRVFHALSEKEFAQGYTDLFIGINPLTTVPKFAWLIEIKYLKTDASPEQIAEAFVDAERQLTRYGTDAQLLPLLTHGRGLKAGALVFVGAQAYEWRAWKPTSG